MIIAGAGSAGIETLGVIVSNENIDNEIVFYDNKISQNNFIPPQYRIINDIEELKLFIEKNPDFCVAIGNPRLRAKVFEALLQIGGNPVLVKSKNSMLLSEIAHNGSIIHPNVTISYGCSIGKSAMLHSGCVIGHKVEIGNFANVGPLASIIGPCKIGNYAYIGAKSLILPNVKIGNNAFIEAGAIVEKDVADFETVKRK